MTDAVVICGGLVVLLVIIRFRYLFFFLWNIASSMNEILKEAGIPAPEAPKAPKPQQQVQPQVLDQVEAKRQRLTCIVAGGQSKVFLGADYPIATVEKWSDKQVNYAFQKYESRLSSLISENIMNSFLDLMSKGLGYVVPLDSHQQLSDDFKGDFILNTELRKVTGRAAYTFGPALALLSVGLITAKHVDWKKILPKYIGNGGDRGEDSDPFGATEDYFAEEREESRACGRGKAVSRMEPPEQIKESGGGGADAGAGTDGLAELVQ